MILRALRLAKRDPARAWLVARMGCWIVVLSALAKVLSLPRALQFVSTAVRPARAKVNQTELSTAVDSLLGANILMFSPSCWKRATVLHRYFALAGVATTIRFGVTRESESDLKGHAWLELNGRPILESSPPVYTVTYSFPSNERFDIDLAVLAESR